MYRENIIFLILYRMTGNSNGLFEYYETMNCYKVKSFIVKIYCYLKCSTIVSFLNTMCFILILFLTPYSNRDI